MSIKAPAPTVQEDEPAPRRTRRSKPERTEQTTAVLVQASTLLAEPASAAVPTMPQFMPWGESAEDFNSRMAGLADRLAMISGAKR
ncbi:MAG TPA: hypothetical protein VF453_09480 [Burkholderiaceae bacterium]